MIEKETVVSKVEQPDGTIKVAPAKKWLVGLDYCMCPVCCARSKEKFEYCPNCGERLA